MTDMRLFWPFDTSTVSEWPGGYSGIRDGVHMGTDMAVPQGTELRATVEGTIKVYNGAGAGGWGIDINRPDGFVVRNWHVSKFFVSNGDYVHPGDVIGLTGGATGSPGAGNSTGPHLHWELRNNTNFSQTGWMDPRPLNPISFDQLNPGPTPAPNKEEEDMAIGAFYRVLHGEKNSGGIWFQEKPNLPLIPISELQTWQAFAANGNKYCDLHWVDIEALINKYGTQSKPSA